MIRYIIFSLTIFFCAATQAQIAVGSTDAPSSFSILQLDGVLGGLRLPRVLQSDRDNINTSSSLAKGLMIYNASTNKTNYWDGVKWATISDALIARNGLWLDGKTIKLGKKLIKDTEINLDGNILNFAANQGQSAFRVNTNVFQIKSNDITFQPTRFTINSSVLNVTGSAINMNPYSAGSGLLTITTDTNNKLTVDNKNVNVEGTLVYKDGKQSADHVLVASENGDAYWALLRPHTELKKGVLKQTTFTISSTETNITDTPLILPPGKWIIFANYSTTSTSTPANNRRYVWTSLYGTPTTGGAEVQYTMMGSSVSINASNKLGTSRLIYLVDIHEEISFVIKSRTSNTSTSVSGTMGENQLYAVSIIQPGQ